MIPHMYRSGLMALALVPAAAGAALAQTADERSHIEALREELAAIGDTSLLLEREREGIARAMADRDNPMLHMELGFLAYRIGELTASDQRYNDAASEFEWATELRPDWAWAWYGLGLAELAAGEHTAIAIENLRQILGLDHLSKAANAFARATEEDPSFVRAVLDLADAAQRQRIRARMGVALEALRRAAQTQAAESPDLQLVYGRVLREMEGPDSALVAFERYLALGGDSALGLLEVARTRFLQGFIPEAREGYYAGARRARSAPALAGYLADVGWLADSAELREVANLSGPDLEVWLRDFWGRRDVVEVRRPGERLAEHFRRYFYARDNFRLLTRHRHFDITETYRSGQSDFDDRGVIYLRHGDPDVVASYQSPGLEPNISWQYFRYDAEPLTFHFVARDDVSDFKLVESLVDVYGFDAAMALQTGRAGLTDRPDIDRGLFLSRAQMGEVYQRLAAGGTAGLATALSSERGDGRDAIATGTSTDSYAIRFQSRMDAAVSRYALSSDDDGSAELALVYALPGRQLSPMISGTNAIYPIEVRLSAAIGGTLVGFVDTTNFYELPEALGADESLAGMVELAIEPGTYSVRGVIRDRNGGAGLVVGAEDVTIFDAAVDSAGVSDLVLGVVEGGLPWISRGDTIRLNPSLEYARGSSAQAYYEVYGLERGQSFDVRIEVRRRGGGSVFGFVRRLFGGGGGVTIEFPAVADGRVSRQRQRIDFGELGEGTWNVRLTIEFPDGSELERTSTIRIVAPRPGV